MQRAYGWKRNPPDSRDHIYGVDHLSDPLASCNNMTFMPPVWDQGQSSSCTGHGSTRGYAWRMNQQKLPWFMPSRLFAYANGRISEGDLCGDNGACIRDVIEGMRTVGVCREDLWPFDLGKITTKPSTAAYTDAAQHLVLSYKAVPQDLTTIKQVLCYEGPIVGGFTVYSSFESEIVAKSGIAPMPTSHDENVGGHCVVFVDYGDPNCPPNHIRCCNSWGTSWGLGGYFYLPDAYLTDPSLSADFSVITAVESYT